MPTYKITAPDGRVLRLTGAKPPTQEQLADIFAAQTPSEPADNYSGLEKAKYAARAGIEGALFGLGDVAAGITNIVARPLGEITQKALDGGGDAGFDWSVFNPVKTFKEGRRDFVNEQDAFAAENPKTNIAGELIGGVIPAFLTGGAGAARAAAGIGKAAAGAKALPLGQKAAQGAKGGALFGALYGAGSGLTEDAEDLKPGNAAEGAFKGALFGAPLGAGGTLAAEGAVRAGRGAVKLGGKILKGDAKNQIRTASAVSDKLDRAAVENIANNEVVRREAARGMMPRNIQDYETAAIEAIRNAQDEMPRIQSNFYKKLGITDETPINLLESDGNASYLRQIYNKIQDFKAGAILPEEVRLAKNMETLFANIKSKAKGGRISFGESKALADKFYKLGQMESKLPGERALYRDLGSIMSNAKNSVPAIKKAAGQYRLLKQAEEALAELLGDKETSYAQKLIRNATERGHEEFNKRLAAIDKVIRQFGGKGFLNEAKILQTARLIEQADKTGIKNLVPSNIWSPKSWLKFLTPKAGTQARYWAQAINSGKVAPENLTGRVNASILPFVGDTITQARALAAARFGVGSAPQEAVNIFGNELGRQAYKSPKAMRKAARKQYKKFQGDILDRDNLQGIRFGRHGIEEIISSSANTDKLNAVPAIPKIIKRGKLGAVRPLYKQRNDRYTGYQYIETPVNYKGKPSKAYVSIAHEQGKGPAFNNINIGQKDASPAIHHNGGAGEAINSITNKPAKNKAQFNVFDLLRVLNSPYYGGIAGGVAADNLRKERR